MSNSQFVSNLPVDELIEGRDVNGVAFTGRLGNKPYRFDRDKDIWLLRLTDGRQFLAKPEMIELAPNFTASDGFEARI